MVAVNQVGDSARSDILKVKASTTPSKITEITTEDQSMYLIDLSWVEPDNGGDTIVDYNVYWDQAIGVYVKIASSTSGQTSFTRSLSQTGSDMGKSFYFKIAAVNSIGEGVLSDPY